MLPEPNTKVAKSAAKAKPASVLLPHTLTSKQTATKRPIKEDKSSVPAKRKNVESDDEDDEESTDFFGFNSAKVKPVAPTKLPETPFLPQAQIYSDVAMPGPSRPTTASNYAEANDETPAKLKTISDEVSFYLKFCIILQIFSVLKSLSTIKNWRHGEQMIRLQEKLL